ncbi:MAG: hypothetical protein MJZ20_11160 [Bacteroidaceae bacterium]|nr:hypothetical protein [Bacteroidaceae bacterium]
MKTQILIDNNHYIAIIEGRNYLIDTGAPFSVSENDHELNIDGINYYLNGSREIVSKVNDSGLICSHIDGIIGLNIISENVIDIDRNEMTISFNEPSMPNFEKRIDLNKKLIQMGGIQFDVTLNSKPCSAVFDTGAFVPYVSSDIIGNAPSIGNIEDYNPVLGRFRTTLHKIDIDIQGEIRTITVAKMTSQIQMMMSMIGVEAVLGIEALGAKRLRIDISNSRLEL